MKYAINKQQLNLQDYLLKVESEEKTRERAEKPYRNLDGVLLPWEEEQ